MGYFPPCLRQPASTYTRYAIGGLPSAGRKISPPGRDLFRPVSVSPPRRIPDTPSAAGGQTESCDPTAGRRGRRPLHALSLRGAKRRGNPFSFFRADSHASVRRGTWAPPYGARRSRGAGRDVRRDGISAGTRAVEHQGTRRGRGQRRATAHRGKLWRHDPLNREKPGNRLRVGQVSAKQ